jgi:diguanylate cyclase (GGDEF)-like protein
MIGSLIERLYLKQPDNLAYYDILTGCKNRNYYDLAAKKKWHGKECYVIFVDVDGLKKVNDNSGHNAGSMLLKAISYNLSTSFSGDIIRYGGDEFIIITEDSHPEDYLNRIERISFGFYLKEPYEDLSSAVRKADEKMYLDKSAKKKYKESH